jgi:hypothetical protein
MLRVILMMLRMLRMLRNKSRRLQRVRIQSIDVCIYYLLINEAAKGAMPVQRGLICEKINVMNVDTTVRFPIWPKRLTKTQKYYTSYCDLVWR